MDRIRCYIKRTEKQQMSKMLVSKREKKNVFTDKKKSKPIFFYGTLEIGIQE